MNFDDRHRAFLQNIIQEGIVIDSNVQKLCSIIFNEKVNMSMIIELINNKLAPISMQIKSSICELTGDKYWSFVSTTYDDKLLIPSKFNTAQKAFLRKIYSEIISSKDGTVSSTDCLNFSKMLDVKLSMGDADIFLKDMIQAKWLSAKNGFLHMGVRSILELTPYFRTTYENNFHNCLLCHEIIFHGTKCENCDKNFHNYCIKIKSSQQQKEECPYCKHPLQTNESEADEAGSPETDNEKETNEPMDVSDEDTDAVEDLQQ